jgi:glycosyltransferase involved in cell wall biosynthesis
MHLFLIASESPPAPGGIATYVGNTAAMFQHRGDRLTIFVPSEQESIEHQGSCTWVRIVPRHPERFSLKTAAHPQSETHPAFPYNVMGRWAALSYHLALTVIDYIRDQGPPDAIESEDYSGLAYFLLQHKLTGCPELQDVPIVLTLHSSQYMLYEISGMPRYQLADYWVGRMEKFSTLAADGIIAPTAYIAQQARAALGDALNIEQIPLPAPRALLNSAQLPTVSPQRGDVVFLGRLEVRKGILPLIAACQRLWDAGVEFCLTAIGNDTWYYRQGQSMKTFLRHHYARYLDAGQLVLADAIAPPQLYTRIAQAWCIVVPSIWENFPNTVLESLLLRKVVLANSGLGHEEMLTTASHPLGLLFNWSNPGSFEQHLQTVLTLPLSELQRYGDLARQGILNLTHPDLILTQRLQHLSRIIAQHQAHPKTEFPSLNYPPHGSISRPNLPIPSSQTNGLVSVCIPFYNHGEFIAETLASVYQSDYAPLEVIVLNDGSSDAESLAVLATLQTQYPHLQIIHRLNQGVAAARNQMAAIATGDYIAFLDSDDRVSPAFYRQAVHILQRYPNVGFIASWLKEFDQSQKVWIAWNPEFPYLLGHNMLGVCSVVRKSAYLAIGGMKSSLVENLEDYECWVTLCEAGWVGVVIPEFHYFYRIRAGSRLGSSNASQLFCLYEQISELHPQLYQRYHLELYNLLNQNGASWLWDNPSLNPAYSAADAPAQELLTLLLRKGIRVYRNQQINPVLKRFIRFITRKLIRSARKIIRFSQLRP